MTRAPLIIRSVIVAALLAACDDSNRGLLGLPPTLALSSTSLTPTSTLGGTPVQQLVTIVNGSDGQLQGLAASVQYTSGTTGWLTATLDRTSATREQAATLRVETTPGALAIGTHDASVVVTATGAANGPLTIRVRFTVQPRPPARLQVLTQPSASSVNGAPFGQQPVVQLLDAVNAPARRAGVAVTVTLASGGGTLAGGTTVLSDAEGRVTFTDLAVTGLVGDRTLAFAAPGLTGATSNAVALTPGAPRRLEATSSLTQVADAGTTVADVPRVRVVDESGNGVSGVSVTFSASAGSTIAPAGTLPTATGGAAGPASWTLNAVAGSNSVSAAVPGLAGSPIVFAATGRPGSVDRLAKQSGDNLIGIVGRVLGTPIVVRAVDRFGNGVPGIAIAWSAGGGGTVTPPAGTTDAQGFTQASRTLPNAPGAVTTVASATAGGATVTATFAATAFNSGPAQLVAISGTGQSGPVGTSLAQPLRVRVLDALDAPLPNVAVTFTTPDAGGTFPGGATIATDANGEAQASWRLGPTAGTQSAQAAVGGPTPVTFTATAAPGPLSLAQSSIAVGQASLTAGGATTTVTVTARDGFGNAIAGLAVALSATGGGTLVQPAGTTSALGQATGTFGSTIAGSKTLSATIAGQALGQSATVTVAPGAPVALVATAATAFAVRFGQLVSTLPAVRVQDAFGNGVPGIPITFAITAGQSTLAPGSTSTNASGVAGLTSWLIAGFTGAGSPQDLFNRVQATAGIALAGSPLTFTGTITVSWAGDLQPYMATNCAGGGCHSVQAPVVTQTAAQLYTTLLNPNQRYVIPGDSVTSSTTTNLLWRKLSGLQSHTGGTRLAEVVSVFKAWIRQGAPNN